MWFVLVLAMIDWTAFESEPFDRQKAFILDAINPAYQTVAAFSGLQGGKTLCGADADYAALYGPNPVTLPPHLINKTPGEFWIISKDYRLARVALDTFRMRVPPRFWLSEKQCRSLGLKRYDSDTYWLAPRKNCVDTMPVCLRVRTASDPEAMRATPNLMLAHCDEIAHWKDTTWRNLQGRAIVAKTKFLITTTPKGKNWLYRDVALPGGYALPGNVGSHTDKSVSVHTWRSVDNPYADQEYLQKLRLKFGPDYAQQELDALFISSAGYVYDFDRTVHMAPPPSEDPADYKARVIGVDPGYGDPYAAGVWLKDWDNNWWCVDEMYLPSKAVVDDAYPWLHKQWKRWNIQHLYVDKRRPTDWELLRRKGLPALPNVDVFGEDGMRTVMPMIRMIQRLFREGRIKIAPHCEWHAEEFENYAYKDAEDRNAGENPIDFKNHLQDACFVPGTMVLTDHGDKAIEDIRVGDLVLTREGYRPVLSAGITRRAANVFTLTCEDGRRVTATGNHPFWVNGAEWAPLDLLTPFDTLSICEWKPANGKGGRIGATLNRSAPQTGTTSNGSFDTCITTYGNTTTGPSPRDITSTTKTEIQETTESRILHACLEGSITATIQSIYRMPSGSGDVEPSIQSDISLKHGTVAPKGFSGIESMDEGLQPSRSQSLACAIVAEKATKASDLSDSVPTLASQPIGVKNGQTTRVALASSAPSNSAQTDTARPRLVHVRVAHVCASGTSDVYNLSVADTPEYFANGILAHNCRYAICSVDALPEDRRPRYRSGADMMPRPVGHLPERPGTVWKAPTVADSLAAQERRWDSPRRPGRQG